MVSVAQLFTMSSTQALLAQVTVTGDVNSNILNFCTYGDFPHATHIFPFSSHNLHHILWIYHKIPNTLFCFKYTPHFLAKVPKLNILGLTSPVTVHILQLVFFLS